MRLLETLLASGMPGAAAAHENGTGALISPVEGAPPAGTDFSCVPHSRFILPLSGAHRIVRGLGGRRDDRVVRPGEFYWMRPNDWYVVRNDSARTVFSIVFHSDYTRYAWYYRGNEARAAGRAEPDMRARPTFKILHHHTHAPASEALRRLIVAMQSAAGPVPDEITLTPTARALLAWCLRELHADVAAAGTGDPGRRAFDEICAYIMEHLATGLEREQVAGQFRISADHLTRLFRNHARCGYVEFVRSERFKRAETLLAVTPRLSIKEVAAACGFNLSAYFIKRFRETYGVTPAQWRKAKAALLPREKR